LFAGQWLRMRIWLAILICAAAALVVDFVWFDGRNSQAVLGYLNIRYSGGGRIGISAPDIRHFWRTP
jgi:hypothetical protein